MSSTATPADVQGVINTDLTDTEIQSYLDDSAFEAGQAIDDYSNKSTEFKTQLEKYLGALRIRQFRDRAVSSASRETASMTYEGMSLADLKEAVNRRDPTGTLAYQRNTDRYVGSTNR